MTTLLVSAGIVLVVVALLLLDFGLNVRPAGDGSTPCDCYEDDDDDTI